MTERPILFSAPMIHAILKGRKTQTRRVLKPQPNDNESIIDLGGEFATQCVASGDYWAMKQPRYQIGDVLWVREALVLDDMADLPFTYAADGARINWKTRDQVVWLNEYANKNCPSIHMPRWASRIDLRVTDVKIERLNDISEDDAKAEGADMQFRTVLLRPDGGPNYTIPNSYKGGFANLWQSINGVGSWEANPWVVAVEFQVVKS